MAKEIAKARGEKQILKIGYEHQILDNEYCYDENGDLISCNDKKFASTNTLAKIIYGLKDNQFETKNLYYKILDLNETNLTIPKENILTDNLKVNTDIILINFSNAKNLSFEAQGKELAIMLNKIKNITNKKDFILVGHSMGGIAIREYMQNYYNEKNITIDGIITIATPHKGINYNDVLGITGASGKNLMVNSEDMKLLNTKNSNIYDKIPFISFRITGYDKSILNGDLIAGDDDDGVVPGFSQTPPFNSLVIDFKPQCQIDINCISTGNAIYHTQETSNPLIIKEVKKFVANQIKLNKGWNLVSGEFEEFNLKPIILSWKYDTNWSAYSNNTTLQEKIKNSGYDFFNQAKNNQGMWIYSKNKRELLTIETNTNINYQYKDGWSLAGTNKEINASSIKCINNSSPIIWKYNNKWQVYFKEKKDFNLIEKNEGYWVGCF
jgi:uncharacterized alpha/beta hydrolase family protein